MSSGDTNEKLLSQAELDLLQSLFTAEPSPGQGPTDRVLLHLDPSTSQMLPEYLTLLGEMTLKASRAGHDLAFPFQVLNEPEKGVLAMELRYPTITERHPGHNRSLRVHPRQGERLQVVDPSGRMTTPKVDDLSLSGVSVLDHPSSTIQVGEVFSPLLVQLPHDVIQVEGRVVRRGMSQDASGQPMVRLAISLSGSEACQTKLSAYVFNRYREVVQRWGQDPFA